MFGVKIKNLRNDHQYSMDKLCELYNNMFDAKMNKSTLSRYENGVQEPMYTVVKNLDTLFNVSVDFLTNDDYEEKCFSEEELDLIKAYRKFDIDDKAEVRAMMRIMLRNDKYDDSETLMNA